jgi:hypothetical protein
LSYDFAFRGFLGILHLFRNFRMIDFTGLEGDQWAKQIIQNIKNSFLIPVEAQGFYSILIP